MKDISTITLALQNLLKRDPNLKQFNITRNEYVNSDPGYDKWIGIYKGKINHEVKYLMGGRANSYKSNAAISIVVQAFAGLHFGKDTDDILERRVKAVIDRVVDGTKIGGTVLMVGNIEVDYQYSEDDDSTMPFQNAAITIHVEY